MSSYTFQEDGYVLVKNVLKNDFCDFITQYALFDELQNFNPDGIQVPNAHSKYADPAMESLLLYLKPEMEAATKLELYPTYSFYRVYRNGDTLFPHKDRPSCEISATVCLNYSYDSKNYSWPIIMDGKEIVMEPGDMVVYRGIDLEHSRDKFDPQNKEWHVQAFLHYVDADGPYEEYKYDKREFVGLPAKKENIKKPYIQYL